MAVVLTVAGRGVSAAEGDGDPAEAGRGGPGAPADRVVAMRTSRAVMQREKTRVLRSAIGGIMV